jgi:hypothetical protein
MTNSYDLAVLRSQVNDRSEELAVSTATRAVELMYVTGVTTDGSGTVSIRTGDEHEYRASFIRTARLSDNVELTEDEVAEASREQQELSRLRSYVDGRITEVNRRLVSSGESKLRRELF